MELNQQLKEVFGYDDKQLLKEFEAAEQENKEYPERILKAPQDEFERIMERVKEERGKKI